MGARSLHLLALPSWSMVDGSCSIIILHSPTPENRFIAYKSWGNLTFSTTANNSLIKINNNNKNNNNNNNNHLSR